MAVSIIESTFSLHVNTKIYGLKKKSKRIYTVGLFDFSLRQKVNKMSKSHGSNSAHLGMYTWTRQPCNAHTKHQNEEQSDSLQRGLEQYSHRLDGLVV